MTTTQALAAANRLVQEQALTITKQNKQITEFKFTLNENNEFYEGQILTAKKEVIDLKRKLRDFELNNNKRIR